MEQPKENLQDFLRNRTPHNGARDNQTHEPIVKDYQDEEESRDSKLKATWDEHIGDVKKAIVSYRKAYVLLLSWDEAVDDLKTDSEVKELARVFQETFKYEVVRRILTKDARTKAQLQINVHLAQFVHDHDDTNTLLIVYYAGHGKPGSGSVILEASKSLEDDDSSPLHEIVWNSAEHNIKHTKSDVFVIFDCCYAGALDQNVRSNASRPAFEFLAATSANSTTKKPGPKSFTSALIWALEDLGKTVKRFPTQELVAKILRAPNFPQDQAPRLGERGLHASLRRIVLAPLNFDDRQGEIEVSPEDSDGEEDIREDLSVRFVFSKRITETLVRDVGTGLRRLITEGDFHVTTVIWEGINSSGHIPIESPILRDVARKWLSMLERKKSHTVPSVERVPHLEAPRPGSLSSEDRQIETPEPENIEDSSRPIVRDMTDETVDITAASQSARDLFQESTRSGRKREAPTSVPGIDKTPTTTTRSSKRLRTRSG